MVGKFNIGDIVFYDSKLYKIVKLASSSWNDSISFVYGIALVQSSPKEPLDGKLILVREDLLKSVPSKIKNSLEILYGKNNK